MASLMIFPDEIMIKIVEYLLQDAKFYFRHSPRPGNIAHTPHRPIILRITAVNSRLRGLAWSYLKRHGWFTAAYLDNLLHESNRFTTFEHIECLNTNPKQCKHFVRPSWHSPAAFLSSFPNLKQVTIWLQKNYKNEDPWSRHAGYGGSKAEEFVRGMISEAGIQRVGLLFCLHSPNPGVDVVIEISYTIQRRPVSEVHFPLASQR